MIALSIGVCTFTSCTDKEKDDLLKEDNREKVDPNSVLTISKQQAAFSRALNGLGNKIDFTNIAQAVTTVLTDRGYHLKWETAMDSLRAQNPDLEAKLDALKNILDRDSLYKKVLNRDSIYVDFEKLYFEAEIAFRDTVDSTRYFRYISSHYNGVDLNTLEAYQREELNKKIDSLMIPVILDFQNGTDQLKIKVNTGDGNYITLYLKGQNDTESRLSVTVNDNSCPVALPSILDFSLSLNEEKLISVNADYTTDFKVEVKGTKTNEDDDFKLSYLTFDGSDLSLNAGASLDIYSVKANASYDDENGFNVGFAANISNEEAVSGNIHLKAKNYKSFNWAMLSGVTSLSDVASLLGWTSDPSYFKGIDCNVNVFKDQIRMKVNIGNPLANAAILQLFATLMSDQQLTLPDTTMTRLINEFNKVFKGEIYFKGYDQPQAKVKLAYEPPTKGSSVDFSSIKDIVVANFERLGLKIGIETYDDQGYKTLYSFKNYFGGIDVKSFTDQIKNKFELTFGPMISGVVNQMFGSIEKKIDQVISNPDEF